METISSPRKRNDPQVLRKKIAELPSLYSDTVHSIQIGGNLTTAKHCLCWIYISLYFQYWETDKIIKAIGQKAYVQNYNGQWKNVQAMLETQLQSPEQFEQKYFLLYSPYDFFGNFLPLAERISRTTKVTKVTSEDKRPVRKPIYRRGYKDKGSTRLPSEYHGEPPLKPEREDRRHLIKHPLLEEESSSKIEESVAVLLLREEEDLCFYSQKIQRITY